MQGVSVLFFYFMCNMSPSATNTRQREGFANIVTLKSLAQENTTIVVFLFAH